MRTYTFTIEDKAYTLKYDFNSICDIEEMAKEPIGKFFKEENVGVNQIRILLWGGLKWKIPGITKQQVGYMIAKMIEANIYETVIQEAMTLFAHSLPQAEGENKSQESNSQEGE